MKTAIFTIILLSAMLPGSAQNQVQSTQTAEAQSQAIRITSPRQNVRQTANFVDVRYELTNPTAAAASSPTFRVQLDSSDPLTTTTNQQSFTGLTPGPHVVTIQLVDANGTVIGNSQTQVQFTVVPTVQNGGSAPGGTPASSSGASTGSATPSSPQAKAVMAPGITAETHEDSLPPASSSLPILSVIGFGVLVGGVASAMKTR